MEMATPLISMALLPSLFVLSTLCMPPGDDTVMSIEFECRSFVAGRVSEPICMLFLFTSPLAALLYSYIRYVSKNSFMSTSPVLHNDQLIISMKQSSLLVEIHYLEDLIWIRYTIAGGQIVI